MRKLFLGGFFFVMLIGATSVMAQGIVFEHTSWNEIVKKAKEEKKLIFMDAYATWCGPCKALQARVFPEKEVGDYFNKNFINAKIDMESGEGPTLAAKYRVQAYPTLFFIDPVSGKVVHQAMGFRPAPDLITIAKQANSKKGM